MRRALLALLLSTVFCLPAVAAYADVIPSVHSGDLRNCTDFASQAEA